MFENSCKNDLIVLSDPYYTLEEAVKGGFSKIKSYSDSNFYEYGFWVVYNKEADAEGNPRDAYRYTTPQTSCSEYKVELTKPAGIVKAHCHSHPKGSEHFSKEDRDMFEKFAKDVYPTPFYLRTPMSLIKVADKVGDFLAGRPVK